MAKIPLSLVVAVALVFFSLTLTHARIPANIPGDEVVVGELPGSLPESDVNPIIRLPSDAEDNANEPARETQESETLPLHVVRFLPADRRFRVRFPFRCRHHHHHHHQMFMPMRQHQEVPYGDDMILASGENADFDPGMFQGDVRRIPARWVNFRHHHHHHHDDEDEDDEIPKFMLKHSDSFDKEKFKKNKNHHHQDDDEEHEEERFKEHKERKEGSGFLKRIRKFLDHF